MSNGIYITGGTVVTMDATGTIHHGGTVVIDGDRITAVHAAGDADVPLPGDRRVIDASGRVVMPGFVDLHYHTAIERGGYSESLEVEAALFDHWYPMVRGLDAETAYWGAMYSYLQAVRGGTTTVNDMFRRVESLAAAAGDIGIRATLSSLVARPEDGLDSLADNAAAHHACHGSADGRVAVVIGIEWLPLATPDLLHEARALADDLGCGIHIHLSESRQEIATSEERFGARPIKVAYDYGLLSPSGVAAHCVWLTESDIALLADAGANVSNNPAANAKMGEGLAPLTQLQAAGVNVGLGHDSTEGNNTMDMFDVMRTCAYLQRAVHADPLAVGAAETLAMATANGADALGINAGRIMPGRKADVIVVDVQSDFFDPSREAYRANIVPRLVFASHGSMVRTTIIDGRIVVDEGTVVTVDAAEVTANARRAVARLVDSIS